MTPTATEVFADSTTIGDTTLSSHDCVYNEFLVGSTSAGDATHSDNDIHLLEHVYSSTSSCQAQPGGVHYPTLSR
jgi:hypothetical protein